MSNAARRSKNPWTTVCILTIAFINEEISADSVRWLWWWLIAWKESLMLCLLELIDVCNLCLLLLIRRCQSGWTVCIRSFLLTVILMWNFSLPNWFLIHTRYFLFYCFISCASHFWLILLCGFHIHVKIFRVMFNFYDDDWWTICSLHILLLNSLLIFSSKIFVELLD